MVGRGVLGVDLRQSEVRLALVTRGFGGLLLRAATVLPVEAGAPPDARAAAVRQWLAGQRLRPARMVVGLPREDVFIRHLTLPPLRRDELRRAVEYELGRHLPMPADKVAFDVLVQRREPDRRWRLLLVAAPRSAVDRAVEMLAAVGPKEPVVTVPPLAHWALHAHCCQEFPRASGPHVLVDQDAQRVNVELFTYADGIALSRTVPRAKGQEVESVVRACLESLGPIAQGSRPVVHALGTDSLPAGAEVLNPPARLRARGPVEGSVTTAIGLGLLGFKRRPVLDLRAPAPVVSPRQRYRRVAAVLLGSAVLLGAGWWTQEALGERQQLQLKSAERRQLEPLVPAVQAELREADRLRSVLAAFEQDRTREISKLDLLGELTRRFPRDVWLVQLVYKRGDLEVIGLARQAQPLIEVLEGSALLKDAAFSGDIQNEGGRERFKIRTRVVREGQRAR